MSKSSEPDELVRLFFEHVRRRVHVERAMVLSSAGLSLPQYRLVHDVRCNDKSGVDVRTMDELRQGGLLAKIFNLGKFQNIARFAPDPADPAFDLLRTGRSLVAFPLFERGAPAGMVVMLGSSARVHDTADLCALATMSSFLGRAIESQKLANQLEVACRALDSELQAAADVQRWLLPPSTPVVANTSIATSYRTSRYSGGDYYDLNEMPDGRLGVLIADVSGKGAAAAVLMVVLRTIVHESVWSRAKGPATLLDYADQRLCAMGLPQRGAFVTAFACAMDSATGVLSYSSAGHNPPRLLRARQHTVVALDGANTRPLGMLEEPCTHTEELAVLNPDDLALLYTDGITEARSPEGGFFGVDRLDETLLALPKPATPASAVKAVARAVSEFAGAGPVADDQTLLALGQRPHKSQE